MREHDPRRSELIYPRLYIEYASRLFIDGIEGASYPNSIMQAEGLLGSQRREIALSNRIIRPYYVEEWVTSTSNNNILSYIFLHLLQPLRAI